MATEARTVVSVTKDERKVHVRVLASSQLKKVERCELDSHADTCVAGSNCVVLEYTGQKVRVSPFSDEYEPMKDVPIASCATAYDLPIERQLF